MQLKYIHMSFSWRLGWKTSCYYQNKITGIVRIAISQFENGGLLRIFQLKVLEVNIEQQVLHTTLSSLVRQFFVKSDFQQDNHFLTLANYEDIGNGKLKTYLLIGLSHASTYSRYDIVRLCW